MIEPSVISRYDPTLPQRERHLEEKFMKHPNNFQLLKRLLILLDFQAPNNTGQGPYSRCQRALIKEFDVAGFSNLHLLQSFLIENYPKWESIFENFEINRLIPLTQVYQGNGIKINNTFAVCGAYLDMFNKKGVINSHCNDCYKVQILPCSVFSMMLIYLTMMKVKLPRNNARKCMLEIRESIKFPYKAYIYCESEAEAILCRDIIMNDVEKTGTHDVLYAISHGCSEYGQKYPAFKYSKNGDHRSFRRPDDWDAIQEDYANQTKWDRKVLDDRSNAFVSVRDMICFETWFRYAEMIGDRSYRKLQTMPVKETNGPFMDRISRQAPSRISELSELRERLASEPT